MRYDPVSLEASSFHDTVPHFAVGQDTPRAYLERCLAQIAAGEPIVKAFAVVNEALARAAADASSARWKAGRPLSAIDGMPVAVNGAGVDAGDTAAVRALREAGAVILAGTVALGLADSPGGLIPPAFDVRCKLGGSLAGAAAVVAARLCPAALGCAARGDVMRSASSCANFALELSPVALDGSAHPPGSMISTGVHAASIDDLWRVAMVIARHARGDPAHADACGPGAMAEATQPRSLIVIESDDWRAADEATRTAFEALMDQIACTGVRLLRRRDHPSIEAFEQALTTKPDDHRALLPRRTRAQSAHAALAPLADAIVMLSAPGPVPWRAADPPGALLLAPAVSLPLIGVDGMPVGAQLMGQRDDDARLVALARWVAREAGTVVV